MSKYQIGARIDVIVYIDAPDKDSAYFLANHAIENIWFPDEIELQIFDVFTPFEVKDEN